MVVNTITQAKAQLSALIEEVQKGEEVIINRAGKPVAILKKYEAMSTIRKPGALKGKIKIADDFDDLPEELAFSFGIS